MKNSLRLPRQFVIRPSGDVTLGGIRHLEVSGVPVYAVHGGNEAVFRLEFMFRAGKLFAGQRHVSAATAALITEGTRTRTAAAIAEALEYYGATVRCYSTPDIISFSVHAMTRFSEPVIEIISEMLLEPDYSEQELQLYQKKKIQRYRLSETQNEYVANRIFSEHMFGVDHPYGYTSSPEDVANLSVSDLREHHELLCRNRLDVFIAGEIEDHVLNQAENLVARLPEGLAANVPEKGPVQEPGKWHLDGPQPHQTSVRIGNQIISRGHDDYPGLFLLNTALGGYHGSRLVRNLREAKGLTYSIQSNLENLLQAGCFVVTTDANTASRNIVVREIYREIKKIRTKPIPDDELEMVRNYVSGNFLMQIDGPLNVVDTIKPLILHRLPLSYFNEFLQGLRTLTSADIQSLAQYYLDPDQMTEVVLG